MKKIYEEALKILKEEFGEDIIIEKNLRKS